MTEFYVEFRYTRDPDFDDDFSDTLPIIVTAKSYAAAVRRATRHKRVVANYWRVKPRQVQLQAWGLDGFIDACRQQWTNIKKGHI